MMNSIRPDATASLLGKGEARNGSRPGKGQRQLRDLACEVRRAANALGVKEEESKGRLEHLALVRHSAVRLD
jgi:hypothetical protein